MANPESLTADRLRSVISYDPESGSFRWRIAIGRRALAGGPAGTYDKRNYLRIRIDGSKYRAGRLAWLYVTGSWPDGLVDHKNRDPSDNRWENLRIATPAQNMMNSGGRANRTGYKGVKQTRAGKFAAYIRVDRRWKHLGTFQRPQAAHEAYMNAARAAFGDFACGE